MGSSRLSPEFSQMRALQKGRHLQLGRQARPAHGDDDRREIAPIHEQVRRCLPCTTLSSLSLPVNVLTETLPSKPPDGSLLCHHTATKLVVSPLWHAPFGRHLADGDDARVAGACGGERADCVLQREAAAPEHVRQRRRGRAPQACAKRLPNQDPMEGIMAVSDPHKTTEIIHRSQMAGLMVMHGL